MSFYWVGQTLGHLNGLTGDNAVDYQLVDIYLTKITESNLRNEYCDN